MSLPGNLRHMDLLYCRTDHWYHYLADPQTGTHKRNSVPMRISFIGFMGDPDGFVSSPDRFCSRDFQIRQYPRGKVALNSPG